MSPFKRMTNGALTPVVMTILIAAWVLAASAQLPARGSEIGTVGPLELPGLDGKPAKVDFDRAKVTIVNFWATWCMPCRQEMPQLDKLFQRYKSKGLQVVGVAVQSGEPSDVKEFLDENIPITYTALVGDLDVMERFGDAEIVPTTYLVGAGGRILARHYGVTRDFEEQIEGEILTHLGLAAAAPEGAPTAPPVALTASDRRVLATLQEDWARPEHLSSVDLAMQNLGLAPTPEARVRLGRHILDAEEVSAAVSRYGPVSVVLSKQEKMILRALLDRERDGAPIPTVQELAALTGERTAAIQVSFDILEELGVVEPSPGGPGVGMRVVRSLAESADPVDLAATIVTEPSGKPFAVGSLPRYLSALVAAPPAGRVVIDGLCSHCVSRVQIVMEKGHVVLPTSAALLLGGGGYDALFLSAAHLQEWLREHPAMKDLPHAELTKFVEALHERPEVALSIPARPIRAAR